MNWTNDRNSIHAHLYNYMFAGNRRFLRFFRRQIINLQEFYSVYSLLYGCSIKSNASSSLHFTPASPSPIQENLMYHYF